jgi:hypothetical protein
MTSEQWAACRLALAALEVTPGESKCGTRAQAALRAVAKRALRVLLENADAAARQTRPDQPVEAVVPPVCVSFALRAVEVASGTPYVTLGEIRVRVGCHEDVVGDRTMAVGDTLRIDAVDGGTAAWRFAVGEP